MNVLGFNGSISQEEFDISHMYCTLRFEKVGPSTFPEDEFLRAQETVEVEEVSTPASRRKCY